MADASDKDVIKEPSRVQAARLDEHNDVCIQSPAALTRELIKQGRISRTINHS